MVTYHCVNAEMDNAICLGCKYSGYIAEADVNFRDEDFCDWPVLIAEEEF